ncbi:MAG: mannitol dehydrogenase family protein [Alteraurantiacibacter sp.]
MSTEPAVERLSGAALAALRQKGIACPTYDRAQASGIVHFGIGAFARAHLAWYTDKGLADGDQGWMITGVSLRSAAVMAQLNPQQGLYSLTERAAGQADTRIIGSIREVLVADRHAPQIVERIADPACHIVSFTVTEKGYCRAVNGTLDQSLAAGGFYPLLGHALSLRADADLPGVTLLCCDNLASNGAVLGGLMRDYLAVHHPKALDWFNARCTYPATMIDRIVPAMTAEALDEAQALLGGCRDEGAIFTEAFSQWVIEDRFAGPRPRWEDHGAQIVADVAPYETAKLRMLNGAHSLLAYCGLEKGHEFVHQAIVDPELRAVTLRLMLEEAAPTIRAAEGQDLTAYAAALVERFENPALQHRLAQIAMDGSQKLPQRWLAVLSERQSEGVASPAIMRGLASWLRHVRGGLGPVNDPLAAQLAAAWQQGGPEQAIRRIVGLGGLLGSIWQPTDDDVVQLQKH